MYKKTNNLLHFSAMLQTLEVWNAAALMFVFF